MGYTYRVNGVFPKFISLRFVGLGQKFFEKNIKQLTEMNKLPEPEKKHGHYTPEDIGVTEETQGAYEFAQQRVMAQLGMQTGIHRGNLEEYGPEYEDPEKAYKEAQRKIEALYNIPSIRDDD